MNRFDEYMLHHNKCDANQRGDDALGIVSMTCEFEPQILNKAVKLMPESNIAECGSWVGAMSVVLATSMQDRFGENTKLRLHSIDPLTVEDLAYDGNLVKQVNENSLDLRKMYDDNMTKWQVDRLIVKHRMKSQDVDIDQIPDLGLLFIDSSHEEESVVQELYKFTPKVIKDGYVILHDKNLAGVDNAIKRFMKDNKEFNDISAEFITSPDISRHELAMGWIFVARRI